MGKQKIGITDLDTGIHYESINACARAFGVSEMTIGKCLRPGYRGMLKHKRFIADGGRTFKPYRQGVKPVNHVNNADYTSKAYQYDGIYEPCWADKPVLCIDTQNVYPTVWDARRCTGIRIDEIKAAVFSDEKAGGMDWRFFDG